MKGQLLQINNKNAKLIRKYSLIISYALTVIIAILVYILGGTSKVYANFMFIPIIIIASTNGTIHAVVNAIICAVLVGPIMPLEVASNTMQEPQNWIIRLIIYLVIASVTGYFADHYKHEYEKNIEEEKEITEVQMATIFSLVKLSEARDEYTCAHVDRVGVLCRYLTCKMRKISKYKDYIDAEYIENVYKASPLHDIGKVSIPDSILLKPGKLSPEEFNIMKTHTIIGANTLLEFQKKYPNSKFLDEAINIAYYHHEKWDGTGYSQGLSGDKIPLSARIMAFVDVYDALRSKRVYKEAYSHEKSVEIIKQGKGSHFDPTIVNVFLENEAEFKKIFERMKSNELLNKPTLNERLKC